MNQCNKIMLWRWSGQLISRFSSCFIKANQRFRKLCFYFESYGCLNEFECGAGVTLRVPVRVGAGKGGVRVDYGVGFGWPEAPMLGNGGILIEPRSRESIIEIGYGSILSNNISIIAMEKVTIGRNCLIGDMTSIFDCDFHDLDPTCRMSNVECRMLVSLIL